MSFLALILGLLLLQFWGADNPVQRDGWFRNLRTRLGRYCAAPLPLTLLAILLCALVAVWVLELLRPLLFGLAWILAAGVVLLYSFGRGDFQALAARYRAYCLEGDFEAAWLYLGRQLDSEDDLAPASAAEFQHLAQRTLLYEGFQRWFPVLLYFLLLGPAGALAYRLSQLSREASGAAADRQLVQVLDWLPSRLLALSFAVTGNFVRSRDALRDSIFSGEEAAGVLQRVARAAALDPAAAPDPVATPDPAVALDDGARAAHATAELTDLLSRSAVLWVMLVALAELL